MSLTSRANINQKSRFSADAIKFQDNFLNKIEFNNFYITDYFRKIDYRRLQSGRTVVLPLKNSDIGKYVDPDSSRRIAREFEGSTLLALKDRKSVV